MATTTFNDLITFSRGSNATVTGPNGLIQWAPSNIATNSQDFEAGTWTKNNSAVYPNQNFAGGPLGPELVVNGNFATDTNWTKGVGWTISGGAAVATAVASFEQILQNIGVVAGRTYQVSVTATVTSGSFSVGLGNSGQNIWVTQTTSGTYAAIVTVVAGTGSGNVYARGNPTFTGTIDDISVREVTPAAAVAPDGTQTADTWIPTSSGTTAGSRLLGSFTVTSGSIQTASIYVKSAGKRWLFLTTPSAASANDNCWFDLQNGVVGTIGSSALSATMTAVGNGWYRVTTTSVAVSATNYIFVSTTTGDNTTAVTADGTGILIWGAQLELGSTATTYNNTSVRNLLGFSEAFDNAVWSKGAATLVTGAQANPVNGLFNAQKLMEDTTNAQHLVLQNYAAAASIYTYSIYVKAAERSIFGFNRTDIGGFSASYNLATGTVRSISGFTNAQIVAVGDGWYRVSCMLTLASATTIGFGVQPYNALGATVYTGDGNSGIYIYGAMLSNSASLDPYVPTPGAAPSSTAYYGPRFDYDPVTLAARGFLVEEARTNLLTYSADFTNAAWTASQATVTGNSTIAPDGTLSADTLTLNATTYPSVFATVTTTTSTTYTATVYAKAGTASVLALEFRGVSSIPDVVFNLANGTVTSGSGQITPAGNGWYRCSVTKAAVDTSELIIISSGLTPAIGTTLFLWGAQLEAGTFATSYIPTIASTVTRSADVATITGSLFSQWYRQAEGTFVFDFGPFNFAGTMAGSAPYDTAVGAVTNGVRAGRQFSAQNQFGWNVQNKTGTPIGTSAISGSGGFAPLNGPAPLQKLAVFQTTTSMGGVVNGGIVSSTALTVTPTGASDLFYINPFMNGWFRSIRYVPVRAADFQLQALTELPLVPTLDVDFINNLYEA